jgi:putative sigma-54 modulation protein
MANSDTEAKRSPKRSRGRTRIDDTPLLTHARVALPEVTRESIEERLRHTLAPFGTRISRAEIRLDDVNGPRGGVGLRCSIDVLFAGGDRVRIEQDAAEVLEAVRRIMPRVAHRVRQHVGRSGHKTPRATLRRRALGEPEAAPSLASLPEAAASAGSNGKHGKHDGRQNDSGMTYALEDSSGKPSRKSTRASSNHIKAATQLTRRTQRALSSPQARAAKSAA